VFLLLLVVAVLTARLLAPYGPLEQDLHHVFALPSGRHWLGTDNLGRDVLSRLLYGGRVSLLGAGEALAAVMIVGVPAGLIAGYRGGWVDAVVVRLTDIVLAIPVIVILLVVLAIFPQNETAAMITLGILGAPGIMRVARGAAISVRPELYLTAARMAGLTQTQILRRHVLPRVAGPVIVQASLFAGAALVTETGLGFLGLGVQDPDPSWGNMVANASNVISQHPWLLVPSGGLIGLAVLAFGLLGDGVRDATGGRTPPCRRRIASAQRGVIATSVRREDTGDQTPTASPLLSVQDLSISFDSKQGPTTVVSNVSFALQPGETLGLVGESGCGKTVTASAILGLLPGGGTVVSGRCLFDGTDLLTLSPRGYRTILGAQIALISQEPIASLDPNFTVGRQIRQVLRLHRDLSRRAARSRTLELLEWVNLSDPAGVAARYPHELSGGVAQRVSIAAALAGEPKLLIADEPTTALDVTVQAEILDLLRDLQHETGLAILLVTHDWGVIADLCQRAAVMYAGEIVEYSTVPRMLARPLHPYTDGLLRSNPHRVTVGDRLPAIRGTVPAPADWPIGCHFEARCPHATAACRQGPIPLEQPEPGRQTRCLHYDELLTGAIR
jgi:oligopeptide/dipeptide ABC transporter ATP-binding protein